MKSFASEKPREIKRRKIEHYQEPETSNSNSQAEHSETENVDDVEEAEEGPETATDGLLEDDDDVEDSSDPFESHFADPDDNILSRRLNAIQKSQWTAQKIAIPKLGSAIVSTLEVSGDKLTALPTVSSAKELKLKHKLTGVVVKQRPTFDILESYIAPIIFGYQDFLYCQRDLSNQEELRRLACSHAVNHIFK